LAIEKHWYTEKTLVNRRICSNVCAKGTVCLSLLKDRKGCGGAIWTNLDVILVTKQNDHIESCSMDEHLAYK
ncbi:hypothetical protein T4D_13546, partial [Trichinella pseudospiralis]